MKTSVVSCTWNRARQTFWGIRSLIVQETPPDEIILVDDGSIDETPDVARTLEALCTGKDIEFFYLRLDHPEARISSIPRNVGLKRSSGDIVIFTEPECLHIGPTVAQMKAKVETDPLKIYVATNIYTMGQSVWNKINESQQDYFLRPMTLLNHPYCQLTDDANMNNTKAPDSDWAITGSYNCFAGCMIAAKREHLMAVGGFDEAMTEYGWDDWDMIKRVGLYLNSIKPQFEGLNPVNIGMENDVIVCHQWHRKDYPYNIYNAAERNGQLCEDRIVRGEYRANIGKDWGNV